MQSKSINEIHVHPNNKLSIERESSIIFTHWIWILGTDTGRVAMLAHLRPLHAQKFRYTNEETNKTREQIKEYIFLNLGN